MRLIRVSEELEISIHEFPDGHMKEKYGELCKLIGNGCDAIEHVRPVRLYTELHQSDRVTRTEGECVSMLVDEEFSYRKGLKVNLIGSYLYRTDKHGYPIMGNILFVGDFLNQDGIDYCGINEFVFSGLLQQLKELASKLSKEKS